MKLNELHDISDRLYRLITKLKVEEYATKILVSKNYKEGKISEYVLMSALLEYEQSKEWVALLTSEIYDSELIPYDFAINLVKIPYLATKWDIISEKYKNGIIKKEHLKLIYEILINQDSNINYSTIPTIIKIIISILTNDNYAEGKISDETINLILQENKNNCVLNSLCFILDYDKILEKYVSEEMIKLILLEKHQIILEIINAIATSIIIESDEKEKYILAVLKLKNKEELEDLYNQYVKKGVTDTMYKFAQNFVLYSLPASQFSLPSIYTRKREK